MRLSAQSRLELIRSVISKEKTAAKACREVGISRKTFYKWLKRYTDVSEGARLQALNDRQWSLKLHGRKTPAYFEKAVLDAIAQKPGANYQELNKIVYKTTRRNLSRHAIYNILKRNNLKDLESKLKYKVKKTKAKLSHLDRFLLFQSTLQEGKKISDSCKKFGISRKTYYKWLKRYHNIKKLSPETFKDRQWKIDRHPRILPKKVVGEVLSIVSKRPELSSQKIANMVGVSNHGVQNILYRNNLNLYEKRLVFAQTLAPVSSIGVSIPTKAEQAAGGQFIPSLTPAPAQTYRASSWVKILLIASIITSTTIYSLIWWIDYISTKVTIVALGTVFASIALAMGSIFFLYSLKYYLSLAIVLSFSQSEQGTGRRPGWASGPEGIRKGIVSWILGLANSGSSLPRGVERRGVGLTPNLEHIILKRHPKISVHIPLYNEKNVVERPF